MFRRFLISLLSAHFALAAAAQTASSIIGSPGQPCSALPLLPGAEQVAEEISVTSQLDRLRTLVCNRDSSHLLDELVLRQQITEAVMIASLDVDEAGAQIDYERAQILETEAMLSNQKNRTINLLSVANILAGTGSGILANAMQFSDRTAFAGDGIGIAGGGAGVLLSILGLRAQGGKLPIGIAPNMLAAFFDREPEKHSVYPAEVWAYVNARPVAYPKVQTTWRDELIQQWVQQKRIGPTDAPGSQKKILLLTSSIAEHTRLSLDLLTDRSAMLMDVRARLLLMKGALRDLLRSINQIDAPRPSIPH